MMGKSIKLIDIFHHFSYGVLTSKHVGVMNFMVAPCINNIKHFIVQLMHKS